MSQLSPCPLGEFALWFAEGADAQSFLQGQLTADLLGLERRPGQLAAACSAQGRVTEILRLAVLDSRILLLLPQALARGFIDRLQRFRMRARVSFQDCGDELMAWGHLDTNAEPVAGERLRLRLSPRRQLVIATRPGSSTEVAALESLQAWHGATIEDGEPAVTPDTQDRWLPQMLNLDLLEAISFSKGCYVGQEIIARTQHLGRIKRRMLRFRYQGEALAPGSALYATATVAGEVVRAAPALVGNELLAVVALEHAGRPLGRVAGADDLLPAPLPYDLAAG